MSDADTIHQALQGAMVGEWGRENAARALTRLVAENELLRDALGTITEIATDDASTVGRLTSMVVVAQLALARTEDRTPTLHD